MADAEMGIAAYFNRQRKSLAKFKAEVDAREGWPTKQKHYSEEINHVSDGYYTLHWHTGDYHFNRRIDAIKFLQKEGLSMTEITDMMGYNRISPRQVMVVDHHSIVEFGHM